MSGINIDNPIYEIWKCITDDYNYERLFLATQDLRNTEKNTDWWEYW
jgi:hypothetical protein